MVKPTEAICLQEYLDNLRQRQQGHLDNHYQVFFMTSYWRC